MMINGVPQPAWMRFATHVTPHFVQFFGATYLYCDVLGLHDL
jgi:hypothetical protein